MAQSCIRVGAGTETAASKNNRSIVFGAPVFVIASLSVVSMVVTTRWLHNNDNNNCGATISNEGAAAARAGVPGILRSPLSTPMSKRRSSSSSGANGAYTRADRIFGYLHIGKTSGTTINGKMALQYERVCGNKGNSYDAIGHNHRVQRALERQRANNSTVESLRITAKLDSVSVAAPNYNRGRVPYDIMEEVGFEDCDWISLESNWTVWGDVVLPAVRHTPIELHVPCRDPLEHLMSYCNHFGVDFQCDGVSEENPKAVLSKWYAKLRKPITSLLDQIPVCLDEANDMGFDDANRFHRNLTTTAMTAASTTAGNNNNNSKTATMDVKCFEFHRHDAYMDAVGRHLQSRRFPVPAAEYAARHTNAPRDKSKECLWSPSNEDLRRRVRQYMLDRYDYYRFCSTCVGSRNDLLLGERS